MTHTPGPWTADRARPNGWVADQWVVRAAAPINATTDVVAVVNTGLEMDARLIAGAPEMAAFLRENIAAQSGWSKARARALLAKIDGARA